MRRPRNETRLRERSALSKEPAKELRKLFAVSSDVASARVKPNAELRSLFAKILADENVILLGWNAKAGDGLGQAQSLAQHCCEIRALHHVCNAVPVEFRRHEIKQNTGDFWCSPCLCAPT